MHSIAFKIGSFPVHWYGILVALGFLAGLWTAGARARLAGISPDSVYDLGPWLIIGGILGARVLYVISYWQEDFAAHPFPEIFMIQHGGLVFYGGLIGAIACGMFYLHWKKLPVWRMADILAPSIALGSAFGRIGCLMNGCCYGRECSPPWAITFPALLNQPASPWVIRCIPLKYTIPPSTSRCIAFLPGCFAAGNSTARCSRFISLPMRCCVPSWNIFAVIIRCIISAASPPRRN